MCCNLARSVVVVQQALALVVEEEGSVVGSSCSGLVEQQSRLHDNSLAGMVKAVQECKRSLAELVVAVEAVATAAVVAAEECMSEPAAVGNHGLDPAGSGGSGSSGNSADAEEGQGRVCFQVSSSVSVPADRPWAFQWRQPGSSSAQKCRQTCACGLAVHTAAAGRSSVERLGNRRAVCLSRNLTWCFSRFFCSLRLFTAMGDVTVV